VSIGECRLEQWPLEVGVDGWGREVVEVTTRFSPLCALLFASSDFLGIDFGNVIE
jgi:hypothetical protein